MVRRMRLWGSTLRTPFNVFVSTFCTNWKSCKEDGKDYTFEYFSGILITNKHRLLEEGKLGGKHQAHLLKGKGNLNHKENIQFDNSTQIPGCLD
jgi:hypothetical protein